MAWDEPRSSPLLSPPHPTPPIVHRANAPHHRIMGPQPQPDRPIPTSVGGVGGSPTSASASASTSTSTTTTSGQPRKKFGKNLNRLVPASARGPPPPTAASGASASTSSSAPSAKGGGLAFLSTKRTASAGGGGGGGSSAAAATATGAGGAAAQPKPAVPVVASKPKSAHDALLTAAAAEAGLVTYPPPEEKEVDAWGTVQEKRRRREEEEERARELERRRREREEQERRERERLHAPGADGSPAAYGGGGAEAGTDGEAKAREKGAGGSNVADGGDDERPNQSTAMAKLAKVRAERRRAEEEERIRRQKEGAARRLRELEEKMGSGAAGGASGADSGAAGAAGAAGAGGSSNGPAAGKVAPAAPPVRGPAVSAVDVENWRRRSRPQQLATQIKLERLGSRTRSGDGGGAKSGDRGGAGAAEASSPAQRMSIMASRPKPTSPTKLGERGLGGGGGVSGRSLWDPNGRTFSSLVGGSSTGVTAAPDADGGGDKGDGSGNDDGRPRSEQPHPVSPLDDRNEYSRGNGGGGNGTLYMVDEYSRRDRRSNSNVSDHDRYAYEEPPPMDHVIHLSSYETTDRGEPQRKSEAPRMLFDPKSGSMVAAKDLPSGGGGGGGGGAERGGKAKRERNRKDRKGKSSDRADPGDRLLLRRPSDADDAADGGGGRSSRKSRKDRPSKRGGGRDHSVEELSRPGPRSRRGGARGGGRSEPKLPRTCGVLYKKDDRGRYVCADGCDADQGYGAHSVPGGRIRNPSGHAAFVKEHNRLKEEAAAYRSAHGYYANGSPMGHMHGRHEDAYRQEYSGYDANGYDYGGQKEPEELAPEVPLVTADEDLKLIVGEDSPTLKPSAREFAPSHAALAAASAPAAKNSAHHADTNNEEDKDIDDAAAGFVINGIIGGEEEEEDDDDDVHAVGLGFDPTLNMDSVMMSPAGSPRKGTVEAEPFELALGQISVVETEDAEGSPRMPFSNRTGKKVDGSRLLGNVSTAWSLSAGAQESDGGNAFASSTFSNWGLLGNAAGGDATDTEAADGEAGKEQTAASFLSLSTKIGGSDDGSPWGTGFGGLSGLGAKKSDG